MCFEERVEKNQELRRSRTEQEAHVPGTNNDNENEEN